MAEAQATIEQRISAALAPEAPPPEAPPVVAAVPEPAPQAEPEPVAEAPIEAPTEAPIEAVESEGGDEAPREEELADSEAALSEAEEVVEEVSLDTFSDLAEHLGIDAADLYALKLPITNGNGERQEVSIGEWKDGYQNAQRAERLTQEAQDLRDQLQAEKQAFTQRQEQEAVESASLLNSVELALKKEYNQINWNELRANNPTEWAVRRQEFQERQSALTKMRQDASQEWDRNQQIRAEEHRGQMAEAIEREHRSMMAKVPEWRDESVMQSEQASLRDYLLESGYNPQEIDEAYDHRAIVLARKAMKYDTMQSTGKAATKKVVKLGKKVLTPGAKRSKGAAKKDAEGRMRSSLKNSGSVDDAAALIHHRLRG
tara:strand:- start:95 stop:1213 length:1119 start_codon:yes stop_codon:yes gene_type:complete